MYLKTSNIVFGLINKSANCELIDVMRGKSLSVKNQFRNVTKISE